MVDIFCYLCAEKNISSPVAILDAPCLPSLHPRTPLSTMSSHIPGTNINETATKRSLSDLSSILNLLDRSFFGFVLQDSLVFFLLFYKFISSQLLS